MPNYTQFVSNTNFAATSSFVEMLSVVRNSFLSCSFTRTAQSGSVDDLSTLTPRLAANALVTYDVFAFNDSWQATQPLFIKVRYLSGVAAGGIRLDFSMGTANDGFGNLTGSSVLTELTGGITTAAAPLSGSPVFAHGDGSYMTLLTFPNDVNNSQFAVFERFYDNTGQPTGSGFHMIATNAAATSKTVQSQACFVGSAPAPLEFQTIPTSRPSQLPAVYDGRLILGLIYPFVGMPLNPSPNILLGNSTDFTVPYQLINYTVYGTTRPYRHAGSTLSQATSRVFTDGRWLLRAN
jgi:hypothetical protein